MIKVILKKNEIVISGHAGYDDKGKDIVCSAVSSSVLTSVNGILSIDKDSIKVYEKEDFTIKILKESEVVKKLLDNMVNMLRELEKEYKEFIKIVKEE